MLPGVLLLGLAFSACSSDDDGGGSPPIVGPGDVTYSSSGFTLLLGVPVASLGFDAPNATGTVESYSIAPDLPAGLTLNAQTGAIEGTPTAAAERTTYTITAAGAGMTSEATIELGVARPPRQSLLLGADGTLEIFAVDAVTGALTPQTSASLSVSDVVTALPSPAMNVLYVLSETGMGSAPSLLAVSVDAQGSTSTLTEIAAPASPTAMAMSADGRNLIIASESTGEVSAFLIDAVSGIPAPAGMAIAAASDAAAVALDPGGSFVWVASRTDRDLVTLDVDASTGELAMTLPVLDLNDSEPASLSISPDGQNLYMAVDNFDFVVGFDVDPADGSLVSNNSRILDTDAGGVLVHPAGISVLAVDPAGTGRILTRDSSGALGEPGDTFDVGPDAVTSYDESGLGLLSVASDGTRRTFLVSPADGSVTLGTSTLGSGAVAAAVTLSGDGPLTSIVDSIYVLGQQSMTVTVFGPDGNGDLVERGSGVPTGVDPTAIALAPQGDLIAVTNSGGNSITLIELDGNGDPIANATFTGAGSAPTDLTFGPDGDLLFVARSASAEVSIFDVDRPNLTLVPRDTEVTGGQPEHLALSPDGQFLCVADTSASRLVVIRVDGGLFTGPVQSASSSGVLAPPAFLSDGRTVLAPIVNNNQVQTFTLDGATGAPTAVVPVNEIASNLEALAVHPGGSFVFGADNLGQGAVESLSLDASTGEVESLGQTIVGSGPSGLAVSANGQRLYVVSANDSMLSNVAISSNGELEVDESVLAGLMPIDVALRTSFQ